MKFSSENRTQQKKNSTQFFLTVFPSAIKYRAPTNKIRPAKDGLISSRRPRSGMDCQHEGGTCEFVFVCWMSGGLLRGSCNGLMQGCCHRTAKATNRGAEAGMTFDLTDLPSTDYGPVVNDASECIDLLLSFSSVSISHFHWSHTALTTHYTTFLTTPPHPQIKTLE